MRSFNIELADHEVFEGDQLLKITRREDDGSCYYATLKWHKYYTLDGYMDGEEEKPIVLIRVPDTVEIPKDRRPYCGWRSILSLQEEPNRSSIWAWRKERGISYKPSWKKWWYSLKKIILKRK